MTEKKVYKWIPDVPDHRDFVCALSRPTGLPKSVDLREHMPPCYDQGSIGSCTAQAIAAVVEYTERKQKKQNPCTPSRLFIYYNERAMEGTVNYDAGAMIRDGIKSLNTFGYCEENLWPYVVAKFRARPPTTAYNDAKNCIVSSYERVPQNINSLKTALAGEHPIVFGFAVYSNFESETIARTGVVNMPGPNEKSLGGHAVTIVGYDDAKQMFLVRNSWSVNWGQKGYFWMPYQYVTDNRLSDDFWIIKMVPQID